MKPAMQMWVLFIAYVWITVGCTAGLNSAGQNTDAGSLGTGVGGITVSTANPNKDAPVTFTANPNSTYNWSVTGPSGEDLFLKCNQVGPKLVCGPLGISGAVTVSVNGARAIVKVLDSGVVNQPPSIDCKIVRTSDNFLLRRVTSLTTADEYNGSAVAGDTTHFDCSNSKDESLNTVKFYINVNNQGFVQKAVQFDYMAPQPGTLSMVIRAVDDQGATTDEMFDFPVACAGAPTLTIDPTKVKVIMSETHNYFDFDASGAAFNSQGPYQYRWDFDSDGIMDKFDVNNPQAWIDTPKAAHAFTQFAGSRKVRLNVRDTTCNWFAYQDVTVNFNIDRLPGPLAPTTGRDYIVQTDIRPLNGNLDSSANGDFTQWQTPPRTDNALRLECNFKRDTTANLSVLEIQSYNSYVSNSSPDRHGLYFKINNIVDTGVTSQQDRLSSSANPPTVMTAQYETADGGDSSPKLLYQKNGACPMSVHISRKNAIVPCTDSKGVPTGVTAPSEVITLSGEFSCSDLSATFGNSSKDVQLKNGYFYCETNGPNQCPGGGGGGSGGIPPVLR